MFYKLDKEKLIWRKDWRKMIISLSVVFILIVSSFFIGLNIKLDNLEEDFISKIKIEYYKPHKEPHAKYIDSLFKDYEKRANIYLSRKSFKGTPIRGYMLSTSAKDVYLKTGVFLPVELALAQAQIESGMGLKGRTPKTNPFNIGEFNTHTHLTYDSTYAGVTAYYKYMTTNYLRCKPIDLLFKNFTNCQGYRYGGTGQYGSDVLSIYKSIKKYIDRKIN
jgi:hypothetical protein